MSKGLSWNTHITNITASANRTLGCVKRNVQTKNKDIRTPAYNSLMRPQVENGSTVWSPYTKEKDKIEKVQRRAARWVSNDYSTYNSVTEVMSNLGWRSLENRFYDARLGMFIKLSHVMRKPVFWLCEQQRRRSACTCLFVSYLVANPEDKFSRDGAQMFTA